MCAGRLCCLVVAVVFVLGLSVVVVCSACCVLCRFLFAEFGCTVDVYVDVDVSTEFLVLSRFACSKPPAHKWMQAPIGDAVSVATGDAAVATGDAMPVANGDAAVATAVAVVVATDTAVATSDAAVATGLAAVATVLVLRQSPLVMR